MGAERVNGLANIIVMGASTGGVGAWRLLLQALGKVDAAILLVQHMPAFINVNFARRLSLKTPFEVKLAEENDTLEAGLILVAPSNGHCVVEENCRVHIQPTARQLRMPVDRRDHAITGPTPKRPQLFRCAADRHGEGSRCGYGPPETVRRPHVLAGKAQLRGVGMPTEAIKSGCVDHVLSTQGIGEEINRMIASMALRQAEVFSRN